MPRFVYDFADATELGSEVLGGKGAGLAEMTRIGLPVPHGFTITTDACREYLKNGRGFPDGLSEEIDRHLQGLEKSTGKRFGHGRDPLLVSVRSGAAVSMPGMMDTILNLGLNDASVEGLAAATGSQRFAFDAYRRLIQMYGEIVGGIDGHLFENEIASTKERRGVRLDTELSADDLQALVEEFKSIYRRETGSEFPEDPVDQLRTAVRAVFESWDTRRAQVYRRAHNIPDDLGTAVNVVQMVFGNKGEKSGTGVAFTRDPSTGDPGPWGEFLVNAQGEDVVAGIRTPLPLHEMKVHLPSAFDELLESMRLLESHYRDMQDIEFTVDDGRLFILQTRNGKRSAAAALKVAVDMVKEEQISRKQAVARIEPGQLDQLLHPMLDPEADFDVVATGLNASPGAAVGQIVLDADRAEELGRQGEKVVLVRWETTPDDIHGFIQAQGILTAHGGMTSHAAVVARGMGKPCVSGCDDLSIDLAKRTVRIGDVLLQEGDTITIDGSTGRVATGEVNLVPPQINADFQTILGWADEIRTLQVYANADTAEDAQRAKELGAEGIGLCRTEHMFMTDARLPTMRAMILASNDDERSVALERLKQVQQEDFEGIFEAMAGKPITIRLLDPPLHEFLPPVEDAESPEMAQRIQALAEVNPMLGLRGCRLAFMYPGIYEMQIEAIIAAANAVEQRTDSAPIVEIMHPLVGFAEELRRLREMTVLVASESSAEFKIGSMIELPRACVRADEIAQYADFFSFGTNDLTQTTLGFSRDDAEGKFMSRYLRDRVLPANPFETLDTTGVGDRMTIAADRARSVNPDIKMGVCGEHGGDPRSISFFRNLGVQYVSCSPFRVPLARLAAAHAELAVQS